MEAGEEGEALNPNVRARHIKKRALRNKGLSISFNDKDLKDFVSGFHKRKKKRRQEAQRQLQEKERRKRIERRKQRKLEKDLALFGTVSSENAVGSSSGPNELIDDAEDELEQTKSVSGTKMYENSATTITVTTMELSRIDEDDDVPDVSSLGGDSEKDLHTSEKKSLKKAAKPTRKKPFMKAKPKSFKKHKKSASKKRKNIRRNKQ